MGSTLSTMHPHDDAADWMLMDDLAERRRIQNRIAQRNYRKKLKRRLEDLERRAGIEASGDDLTQGPKFWIKSKPGLTAAFPNVTSTTIPRDHTRGERSRLTTTLPTVTSTTISRDHTRGERSRQAALLAQFDQTTSRRRPKIVSGRNKTNTSVPAAQMSTSRSAYGTENSSDSVKSLYSAVAGILGTKREIIVEEYSDMMTDRGKKEGDMNAKKADTRRGNGGTSRSEERSAQKHSRHPSPYEPDGTKYGTSSMPMAKGKQHLAKNGFAEFMTSENFKEQQRLISQALCDLSKGFTSNRPRKS